MANTDGPWVRFFASDWLAGTRGMTAAETGVYITLIATMYERADPLPRDDSRLARLCGLPTRNFTQILDRLIADDKITLDDNANLWGRKVDTEVRNRSARAERGRLAAAAKHEQKQRGSSAKAEPMQPPSTSQTVLRARVSEPEPDSKVIATLEAAKTKKRASRLPPEWAPSDDDKAWLRSKWPGVLRGTVETELEKFRNYWISKSGKDATKLDWSRTWQNWMMTARDRAGTGGGLSTQKPQSTGQIFADLARSMNDADNDPAHDGVDPANEQYALPSPRRREG